MTQAVDSADSVDPRALEALNRYFGYDSFRPGQSGIVSAILTGHDVLGVMPTGAGKSICYQIPAAILPGVAIVISPLISLMRDQVDALNDVGLPAAFINTTQTPDEQDLVFAQALSGQIKLLYVAPERLETERFRNFAVRVPISLVAVDEAHCVSQWGQDFRSSYLGIGEFIAGLPTRPTVAAFTATATERVRRDIVSILGLHTPSITVTGFDRPNLYFDVISMPRKDKASWVASYIASHPDESGIVYCATRKETEALAESLNSAVAELRAAGGADVSDIGTIAVAYHGGMSADAREKAQRDFVTDRVPVVVATNAFGMGIDKSNVRFVIHHNMPESIEAYYQEAGRAGRDGEPSRCTLLWNESDIVTRRRLLDSDYENERLTPEEQEAVRASKRRLLDAMVGYCRTTDCLHAYMTRYFGETAGAAAKTDGKCVGGCANCEHTFETIDVTDIARAISRCVHDVNQHVGSGKIVKVLRGSKAQDLSYLNPESLLSFGMLDEVPEARIRDVLSQMATDGFLTIAEGRLPIVGFGPRAAETVAPEFHYDIKKIKRADARARRTPDVSTPAVGSYVPDDGDEALFQKLRALRLDIARELGKPPYIVFSDKTLRDMVRVKPITDDQFLAVNGVGESKLKQYGERFMAAIREDSGDEA
ncbi:DNA helicase RecQ [Bifidobacterium adolescentis]|uniref:DNA helicase RecQ n=2 Tax=Bifidobacterium adolescentis TaxID=1680 RepID=A0AAW5JYE0_BIFAD|nr:MULTISPECIES: DNA helicase RecQ [Bifidobacterium]AII75928.1 ATP-dependent DNA helicase RecQ [Bifidobacterium adolescentis]MBT9854422.1 DNA helicase RecQ [Bifidobacterium adolescentis]MCQ4791961.1 DNA helicase RecQ [Bifidobacterium adolescentis]MDB0656785.1 DNA helicase RecQ [Bifidobacterium adolescentis]MDB0660585.1 DNA helicase RecQ [Bifidobacterium adolescentis]